MRGSVEISLEGFSALISTFFIVYCLTLSLVALGYGSCYILVYRKTSEPRRVFRSGKSYKKIDVVVPVKEESSLLVRKLLDLASQSYPRDLLNIVVVDSSGNDLCESVVRRFSSEHSDLAVVYIKDQDRQGKAHALNRAFAQCTGEICVITDVDVTFGESAVSDLVSNFNDDKIGAVSGMEVLAGRTFEDSRIYRGFYNRLRIAESNIDSVMMCESELAAYRRKLLVGLPENTQCDDMRLTSTIRAQGYRAVYDTRVLFYESEGEKRTTMMSQKIRRARANVHELLRNADLIVARRLGDFSNIILPFEIFLNIVAPILLLAAIIAYSFLLLDPSAAIMSTAIFWLSVVSVLAIGASLDPAPSCPGNAIARLRGGFAFLLAFVEFNAVLISALVLLAVGGPQTNWNPIARRETQ